MTLSRKKEKCEKLCAQKLVPIFFPKNESIVKMNTVQDVIFQKLLSSGTYSKILLFLLSSRF